MERTDEQIVPDHDVVLSNDAILLRAFRLADAEAIYEAVVESKRELAAWLPWCHEKYTLADTIEFLKGRAHAFQKDGEHGFLIIERATGRFVGATGINQIDKAARRANLGYWLRTSATGRGYAATSTLMVARWAFETLELERIEIVVAVGNQPSQRVANRVGAIREGVARKRLRVGDAQHDAVIFSLVRDDVLNHE
ncbi:MAG: GNAT family protein [Pirellulales bacterium]